MNAGIERKIENLGRAIERLGEALARGDDDPLVIDATIQRFEFVFELLWKALKRALAAEGIDAATPRECLKKAYAARWIDDESTWLRMLSDRNETSHVYDELAARRIYDDIRTCYPVIKKAFEKIEAKAREN